MKKIVESVFVSSLTIRERLENIERINVEGNTVSNDELLNRWKLIVGEASDKYFEARLRWSDINKNDLPKLLNKIDKFSFNKYNVPVWASYLDDFFENGCPPEFSSEFISILKKDRNEVPYIDLIIPIVKFFSLQIKTSENIFTKKASSDLFRNLCVEISHLSSQSFLKDMRDKELSYQDYVEKVKSNNYKDFYNRYPSLTRLIFTRGYFWVNNTNKLISDLKQTKHAIKEKLHQNNIKIDHISGNFSETHREGKSVYILTTTNGHKFVYKQRNIINDQRFYEFLNKVQENISNSFYIPWFLNIDGESGFMEYVEHKACESNNEVKGFYSSVGSLLSIFYIFGATDLHSENLIAHGKYPVFVDLETLLNPTIKLNWGHLNALNSYIDWKFGRSVSSAAVLPQWVLGPDTQPYNKSALGGDKGGSLYPKIVWENINKNNMTFSYQEKGLEEEKNAVYFNRNKKKPQDYLKEILSGFEKTYELFSKNVYEINPEDFEDLQIRFVFRPTKTYTLLLDYLNHPDYMSSGVTRSVELEKLAKGLLVSLGKKNIYWNVLEDELKQLEYGDVPYYYTKSNEWYLASDNGILNRDALEICGVKNIKTSERDLNYKDMNFQINIIKNSIKTTQSNDKERYTFYVPSKPEVEKIDGTLIENTIKEIANKIIKEKVLKENRATWVGYVTNIMSHTYGYEPIGLDLANGNIGVGIFLASAFKYTGDKKYKDTLIEAVKPLEDVLDHTWAKNEFVIRYGTGGTSGLGAFLYGFCKLFEYTGEDYFLILANESFKLINTKIIDKSIREDVVSGNAGLLLALIKYYDITKNPKSIKIAKYIKNRIVSKGFDEDKFKNWQYQQDKTLLGYSHGSSGILYALSGFLKYEKDKEHLIDSIKEIMVYEKNNYNSEYNNWPDFRRIQADWTVVSWCHGAIGVGMSRLKLYDSGYFIPETTNSIENAYKKTYDTKYHHLDTLCCGNAGRLDFLLELKSRGMLDKSGEEFLDEIVARLVYGFKRNNLRYFSKFDTPDLNAGFYNGLSGIGYQLLRYLNPDTFDSILLSA